MEGTLSPVLSLFSVSPHSNFSLREKSRLPKIPLKSDHSTFQIRAVDSADRNAASRVSPQRAGLSNPLRKTQKLRPEFLPRRAGHFDPARKMQNLNSEVSPHRAGNMVNRILRKLLLLKAKNSFPLLKLEGDERAKARSLATIYSHPVWMVRRWLKYLGVEEAMRLMIWNNSDPSFSLRVNSVKGFTRADLVERLTILKVPHEPSLRMDDFVCIKTGMQTFIQAGLLKDGLCSVQDESVGLVVSAVDPQPGETIVDCCTVPGGKTLFMASRLRGQGDLQ